MAGWLDSGWPLTGGYQAISPTLRRQVWFDDLQIAAEVGRLEETAQREGRSPAQYLYEIGRLCLNPERLITEQARQWAKDWSLMRLCNVPLARSLDEVPAITADAFAVIERETQAAREWRQSNPRAAK